jgi:hypothetical protein
MLEQTELENALELLGHKAAECEFEAATDRSLPAHERLDLLIQAKAYREEQFALLQTSETGISSKTASSIVDEMLMAGAGYDAAGHWQAPEPVTSWPEPITAGPRPVALEIADLPSKPYTVGGFKAMSNTSTQPAQSQIVNTTVWVWIILAGITCALCLALHFIPQW